MTVPLRASEGSRLGGEGGHAPKSRGTGGFAEGPRGHVVHAAAAEASSGTTRSRCTCWEVTATVINANHAILLLLTRKKGGTVRTPRRWCRRRPWSRRVPAARGEAPAGPAADPRARPCRRPVAGPRREQRCPAKRYERAPLQDGRVPGLGRGAELCPALRRDEARSPLPRGGDAGSKDQRHTAQNRRKQRRAPGPGTGAPFGATSTLRGLVRTASAQRCDSTPRAGADVTPFTLWIFYHQKPNPAPQPAGLSGDRRGSGIGVQVSCPSQRGCLCRGRGTSQTTPIRSHCAGVKRFPSKSPLKHVPPATRLLFPLLNPGACRWKLLCGALSPHTRGDRGRGGAAPSVCTAALPRQTRAGSISHRVLGTRPVPSSDGLPC